MSKGGGKARGAGARRARERYRDEKFWHEMATMTSRFPPVTDSTTPESLERKIRHDDTQIGLREGLATAIKVRNHYAAMYKLEPAPRRKAAFLAKMNGWTSLQFRLEEKLRAIVRSKRASARRARF